MAFDLSAISAYVKDNTDVLLSSAITGSKTAELIMKEGHVQTGIKTSERLMDFDTDAVLQDGDGCGFNASGTTAITARTLTVAPIKVNEALCIDDLAKKYTQLLMQKGSNPESLPGTLEAAYVDRKVSRIDSKMEKLMWQGDTTLTGNADLKWIDGFIKLADAATGTVAVNAKKGAGTITATTGSTGVTGVGTAFSSAVAVGDKIYSGGVLIGTVASITNNTTLVLAANGAAAATGAAYTIAPVASTSAPILASTGITASNAISIFNSVFAAIPEAVLESDNQPVIFTGFDDARTYLMALNAANLYHYKQEDNDLRDGFILPGTGIRVQPTPGLSGTHRIIAASPNNMWMGTDLENEWEQFKMWYDDNTDLLKFKARWRIGVQWGFPSEVVQWLGAA